MIDDYSTFLDATPEDIMEDWLNFVRARDPLMKDISVSSYNRMLAEAIASQFWIYIQLLKQKVADSSVLTAEGAALSALVLDRLPEGRYPGTKAIGSLKFYRATAAEINFTVPVGTLCAMKTEDGEIIEFKTTEEVVLEQGETEVYALAEAMIAGTDSNVPAYTITMILTPVVGVPNVTNDLGFDGGTEYESDEDLRRRYIYTIWIAGLATPEMIEEHIDALEPVREIKVTTIGQGDVLVVVDSEGGTGAPEGEIGETLATNLAAGATAPGMLGASLRSGGDTFEIGDTSGAKVWIRTLQYLSAPVSFGFTYVDTGSLEKAGSITMPAGAPPGYTAEATLVSLESLATKIIASDYGGPLSFDLFMGLGEYPYLWVAPELQGVDVEGTIVLSATPEADLLDNIRESVRAKLASYKIGEALQHADVYRHLFIDYATGRVFVGVDDVPTLMLTCKETQIGFGESLAIESDERLEPGEIDIDEAD